MSKLFVKRFVPRGNNPYVSSIGWMEVIYNNLSQVAYIDGNALTKEKVKRGITYRLTDTEDKLRRAKIEVEQLEAHLKVVKAALAEVDDLETIPHKDQVV